MILWVYFILQAESSYVENLQAESDSSSEMSDGALQNLVATLVKDGGEIEESEMGDVGEVSEVNKF